MIILFPLILLTVIALNFYIGWHGVLVLSYFNLSISTTLYWTVFMLIAFAYLLGRIIPGPLGRFVKVIGSYYFAVMEFSILLLPVLDLAAVAAGLAGVGGDWLFPTLSVVYLVALLGFLAIGSYNAWSPIKRSYEVHVAKKAGSIKQLRVAIASDLHLGNIVGNRHLNKLVTAMNELKPDLILFPGDVLDDVIEPFLRNNMKDNLARLSAQHGVYAILGNHEYIGRNIDRYVAEMQSINIPVLRDEVVEIADALYIAGRKDLTAERADPTGRQPMHELLAGIDSTKPIIAMDHQPSRLDESLAAGVDILLCGHTHRGQIMPNHLITRKLFEIDWGYLLKERMHVIVSSGFGSWGPPIRIGSRSEFIELTVHFE